MTPEDHSFHGIEWREEMPVAFPKHAILAQNPGFLTSNRAFLGLAWSVSSRVEPVIAAGFA